jgi:hypothetical protein
MLHRSPPPGRTPSPDERRRKTRAEKQRRYRQRQRDDVDAVLLYIDRHIRQKLSRWNYLSERDADERNRKAIARAILLALTMAE